MSVILSSKKGLLILSSFLLVLISIVVVIPIATNQRATNNLVQATLARQTDLTKAAANNIEAFMTVTKNSVVLLSQNYELVTEGDKRQALLEQYVKDRAQSPIVGVVITDEKGIVEANATRTQSSGVGVDLSDRDYFTWAKTASAGSVFISEPTISRLGASSGKEVLLFATPIFKNQQFQGALVISSTLEMFGNSYVQSIFQEPFVVYMLDNSGTVLYAPDIDPGTNYFDLLKQKPFFGSEFLASQLKLVYEADQSGGMQAILPLGEDSKLTRSLVSYAQISTPDNSQSWVLVVIAPESSIVSLTAPIYIQEITIIISIFFVILIVIIMIMMRATTDPLQNSPPKID